MRYLDVYFAGVYIPTQIILSHTLKVQVCSVNVYYTSPGTAGSLLNQLPFDAECVQRKVHTS